VRVVGLDGVHVNPIMPLPQLAEETRQLSNGEEDHSLAVTKDLLELEFKVEDAVLLVVSLSLHEVLIMLLDGVLLFEVRRLLIFCFVNA